MDRPNSASTISSTESDATGEDRTISSDKLAAELSKRGTQAWMGRVAGTMKRLTENPAELAKVERRGF